MSQRLFVWDALASCETSQVTVASRLAGGRPERRRSLAPLSSLSSATIPKVTMLDDSIGISSADDDVVRLVNWYLTTADNTDLRGA
jgi:hypothetical protein